MRTIMFVFYSLTVLFLITSCNKNEDKEPVYNLHPIDTLDDNDYQIYTLILNEEFSAINNQVIMQETSTYIDSSIGDIYYEPLKTYYPDIDSAIFSDLVVKSDSAYCLDDKFNISDRNVYLLSTEERNEIFNTTDRNEGWDRFYEKYPDSGGYIAFTRIGFNTAKNQAIVATSHYYASMGARGSLVFLVKNNNEWVIIKIILTWMS